MEKNNDEKPVLAEVLIMGLFLITVMGVSFFIIYLLRNNVGMQIYLWKMKYIINEKKYDLIIKEYLDDLFSNFKISIFLKPKTSKNPLKNFVKGYQMNQFFQSR